MPSAPAFGRAGAMSCVCDLKLIRPTHGVYFKIEFGSLYSLVINNGLDEGTQLPFIRRAKKLGYAVLVLNTNDNMRNNRYIPVLDHVIENVINFHPTIMYSEICLIISLHCLFTF